jgi:hypothetical protein
MTKRICLIGSAPSSVALAPYGDPTFEIWACSPGARPHLKREPDAYFELHLFEPDQPWFASEYVDYLAKMKGPVYMLEPLPQFPTSVSYPKEAMLAEFGPYFFTSSLSWMFALAIMSGATEIALYGVDMSASEEIYTGQRAGCHFFIHEAKKRGILVTIPGQSDLAQPNPLYGYCEQHPMHQKLLARKAELVNRLNIARNQVAHFTNEATYLQGAAEDVDYVIKTWVSDRQAEDILRHRQPVAPVVAAPVAEPIQVQPAADGSFNYRLPSAEADVTGQPLLPIPQVTWGSTPAPEFINGLG